MTTTTSDNPLLAFPGLPAFDRVTPTDVAPAIAVLADFIQTLASRHA
jgi:Zn-dependent oligopeptidase